MLTIANLHKSFGKTLAVDGVSFAVERGQLVGLLGPNGAGKTTTVSMIAGLVTPDQGTVTINGAVPSGDADPVKRRLGLVPQDLALYDELTARANLRLFGSLYGLTSRALDEAIASALTLVGAPPDRAGDRVKTFSGGMKWRPIWLPVVTTRHPAPRRADGRRRSAEPQRDLDNLEHQVTRQGAALHDALHGRSRAPADRIADRGSRPYAWLTTR